MRTRERSARGDDWREGAPPRSPGAGRLLTLAGILEGSCLKGEWDPGVPLRLLAPSSAGPSWSDDDLERISSLARSAAGKGCPVWLVGLSSGANLALKLRDVIPGRLSGVVAIGSAPWSVPPAVSAVPTLFIHGARDAVFPLDRVRAALTERHEAHSRLVVVEGWGHGFPHRIMKRIAWKWMAPGVT